MKTSFQLFYNEVISNSKSLGLQESEECLYHGQSDTNYKLSAGIYRGNSYSIKNEESVFYEFRSKAIDLQKQTVSDWDILFYMQHYGCRTRLLDWTDNLGAALFFALSDYKPGKTPAIYLLNPYDLNGYHTRNYDFYDPNNLDHKDGYSYARMLQEDLKDPTSNKGIWWKKSLAIYPIRKSERLKSQSGYFTIQGTDPRPLDEQISGKQNIWRKIEIPEEIISEALEYLELFGINEFTIYMDMQSLSKYLNRKYNL